MKLHHLIAASLLVASTFALAQLPPPVLEFDENTVFPGNFTSADFNDVAIDDQGNVAAMVAQPVDGVVARINGQLVTIAVEGVTAVPNSSEIFGDFDDHVEIRDGRVAFYVNETVGNADDSLLVFGDANSLTVAAWVGVDDVPGQPPGTKFDFFSNAEGFGFDGSRLAFRGTFPGGSGAYLFENETLSEIVATGDLVDGFTVETASDLMPDANSPAIAMRLSFSDADAATYVWNQQDDSFTRVIGEGDPMPSGSGTVAFFNGAPDIDGGRVVFQVNDGSPFPGFVSLAVWQNGTIEALVDSDTEFPGTVNTANSFIGFGVAGNIVAATVDFGAENGIYAFVGDTILPVAVPGQPFDGSPVDDVITSQRRPFVADDRVAFNVERENDFEQVYSQRLSNEPQAVPTTGLFALFILALVVLLVAHRRLA